MLDVACLFFVNNKVETKKFFVNLVFDIRFCDSLLISIRARSLFCYRDRYPAPTSHTREY
jgi:hypothetical protein